MLPKLIFKKFCSKLLFVSVIFSFNSLSAEIYDKNIPMDIYMWIQSTARVNYWFNHKETNYVVKSDGTIDLNTLSVPTIYTYDDIQVKDVLQKRHWQGLSTWGYENLIGRADYLRIDLKSLTVTITRRVDLDDTLSELEEYPIGDPININELSKNDARYKLYWRILEWARDNNDMIINRSRGKLSSKDKKLKASALPINKLFNSK